MRKNISSATPSEIRVGYSRAVLINNQIIFSGTTSQNERGKVVGKNVYEQTKFIFSKIKKILESQKFKLSDVVLIRAFLVDLSETREFDKAFKEYFYKIKPACTLVGINKLIDRNLLIEIECIAQKD